MRALAGASQVPLAKAAMRAGMVVNGAASLGRMFGFPVPKIPSEVFEACGTGIQALQQGSSVEEYTVVEEKLAANDGEPTEKAKGYLQRQLCKFLDDNDPDQDWAGLSRVMLSEGSSIWCCAGCCRTMEQHPGASFEELRALVESSHEDSHRSGDASGRAAASK